MACNPLALGGIGKDCGGSKGGVTRAWIANRKSDTFKVTKNDSGETTDVTITTGESGHTGDFNAFYFRKNTSTFTSTLNVDLANGVNYVSTEINLVFHRMCGAKRIQMNAISQSDMAVVVKDGNGKYWMFGVEDPVVATAGEGAAGTQATDGNRYSVTLTDESSDWPWELTDEDAINALEAIDYPQSSC